MSSSCRADKESLCSGSCRLVRTHLEVKDGNHLKRTSTNSLAIGRVQSTALTNNSKVGIHTKQIPPFKKDRNEIIRCYSAMEYIFRVYALISVFAVLLCSIENSFIIYRTKLIFSCVFIFLILL